MAVSIDTKPIDPGELKPAGPIVVQPKGEMHSEPIMGGLGGVLEGTKLFTETWYHWKTGTTSELPKILHDTYAAKPDFHTEPNEEWHRKANNVVTCPACDSPVRIIPEVDNAAMEALGFTVETGPQEKQRAVLGHMKAFHKNTFANLLATGQVTETMAKNL